MLDKEILDKEKERRKGKKEEIIKKTLILLVKKGKQPLQGCLCALLGPLEVRISGQALILLVRVSSYYNINKSATFYLCCLSLRLVRYCPRQALPLSGT
jgi:hypothetical protein